MSSSLDKALMALSVHEDDEPFIMPSEPEFCSKGRNALSLVGRILNPQSQKVSNLLLDLPRKWQKVGKVRGVALSKEKFQFFFNHMYDLDEIFEKGVHTANEWALVMERWEENPPPNYLQFVTVWVQIRNLPINYFTVAAIAALAETIGQVVDLPFDTDKPQLQDFVRVKIRLDVSKPLKTSKMIKLPDGELVEVRFNYERIQKRCYQCQRLIHDKTQCPLLITPQNKVDVTEPTTKTSEEHIIHRKMVEKKVSTYSTTQPLEAPNIINVSPYPVEKNTLSAHINMDYHTDPESIIQSLLSHSESTKDGHKSESSQLATVGEADCKEPKCSVPNNQVDYAKPKSYKRAVRYMKPFKRRPAAEPLCLDKKKQACKRLLDALKNTVSDDPSSSHSAKRLKAKAVPNGGLSKW